MKLWGMGIMIYLIILILAYCSIVYELVMAQSLSAFLGDTVLRYSTTVGLYMASLGIGAFLCRGNVLKRPVYSLMKIEILLSVVGGFCLVYLHLFSIFVPSVNVFFLFSHALIIAIGILSGFEIPLLIDIKRQGKGGSINPVLGVNYFGALMGAVIFPILLLPKIGVLLTAFLAGLLNAMGGLLLVLGIKKQPEEKHRVYYLINFALVVVLVLCVTFSKSMEGYFIARYISP